MINDHYLFKYGLINTFERDIFQMKSNPPPHGKGECISENIELRIDNPGRFGLAGG